MNDITNKHKSLQAIINADKEFLSSADIAPILGANPHNIRLMAKQRPELLGFPVIITGSRVKIPRIPFLQFMGVNHSEIATPKHTNEGNTGSTMTNMELLIAITHELDTFKQEIFERLDAIESQTQDLNNVLQSAGAFINALTKITSNREQ